MFPCAAPGSSDSHRKLPARRGPRSGAAGPTRPSAANGPSRAESTGGQTGRQTDRHFPLPGSAVPRSRRRAGEQRFPGPGSGLSVGSGPSRRRLRHLGAFALSCVYGRFIGGTGRLRALSASLSLVAANTYFSSVGILAQVLVPPGLTPWQQAAAHRVGPAPLWGQGTSLGLLAWRCRLGVFGGARRRGAGRRRGGAVVSGRRTESPADRESGGRALRGGCGQQAGGGQVTAPSGGPCECRMPQGSLPESQF